MVDMKYNPPTVYIVKERNWENCAKPAILMASLRTVNAAVVPRSESIRMMPANGN